MHYFSIYFLKNLTNNAWIFRAFWQKTQIVGKFWESSACIWLKFNWKILFWTSFGKVVAKNWAFGNNIIFLEQFFPLRGGGVPCVPPHPGGAYVIIFLIEEVYVKLCVYFDFLLQHIYIWAVSFKVESFNFFNIGLPIQ